MTLAFLMHGSADAFVKAPKKSVHHHPKKVVFPKAQGGNGGNANAKAGNGGNAKGLFSKGGNGQRSGGGGVCWERLAEGGGACDGGDCEREGADSQR